MAATPDGLYVLAGGKSGKVYAWEAATGSLVRAWDAHFKAVTCLALTTDGGVLLTGSEDTLVKAWPMAEVVVDDGNGAEDPAGTYIRGLTSTALACVYMCACDPRTEGTKGCNFCFLLDFFSES